MLILITKGFYAFGERKPCMQTDMTHGPIMRSMLSFAAPMVLGNLLQQCYNIADTLIVGRYLGSDALAAVGSSVYAFDIPDLYPIGLMHGQRGVLLNTLRREGRKGAEGRRLRVVCAHFVADRHSQYCCVYPVGQGENFHEYPVRGLGVYEGLSCGYFLRDLRHVSLQLLRFSAEGGGKFRCAACVSRSFGGAEYRT